MIWRICWFCYWINVSSDFMANNELTELLKSYQYSSQITFHLKKWCVTLEQWSSLLCRTKSIVLTPNLCLKSLFKMIRTNSIQEILVILITKDSTGSTVQDKCFDFSMVTALLVFVCIKLYAYNSVWYIFSQQKTKYWLVWGNSSLSYDIFIMEMLSSTQYFVTKEDS